MKNNAGTKSIRRKIAAWNRLKRELPALVGNLAVNHFKQSFRNQGFTDESLQPWQPRKSSINNAGRAILVKTGNLRNSIFLKSAKWPNAQVISQAPYAVIHNYGGTGLAWGKHKFKMPKRKFMGQSNQLDKKTIELLRRKINRAIL